MAPGINHEETTPQSSGNHGLTIAILGCGALGTAILSGLLSSRPSLSKPGQPDLFTTYIACVRCPSAAEHIRATLAPHLSSPSAPSVQILDTPSPSTIQSADVVLLAVQPHLLHEALAPLRHALAGKLLISVLAGVSESAIRSVLSPPSTESSHPSPPVSDVHVIRAMPNTASSVLSSMTVIARPSPSVPARLVSVAEYVFSCVGRVRRIEPGLMDVCTSLCGSSPAFFAIVLDGIADAAVAGGVGRREALEMAAQAMKGTAELVLEGGRTPMGIRDEVASPGGSTIVGVMRIEEGGVRAHMADALGRATARAERLGRE